MMWKKLVFWLFVFAGLCVFFLSFGIFTFQWQEEVQLFIPEWAVIRDMLFVPGGFCKVAGQALVQYYTSSVFILLVNSLILCATGYLCYSLLQEIAPGGYNLLLALFPVLVLVKAHTSPFYVIDGTVGLFLLLLFTYGFIRIRRTKGQLVYGVASVILLYGLAGQIAAFYGLVAVSMNLLCRRDKWYCSFVVCFTGLLLTYASIRLATGIPLTDGIYSERYQESQLQPDSYMYYVWIRYIVLLVILLVTGFAMQAILPAKRSVKIAAAAGLSIILIGFSSLCMPGSYEVLNNRINELSVLGQRNDWDVIIRKYKEKRPADYVSLNYLNMALAHKGLLGDRLFHFDQRGPQGLLIPWDRSYYASCLLSDIHYMIGDISLSEGYAMEGLTLAKRGGSPRMLQRLVKISLIRRDFALADKYLGILGRLPNYRHWTEKYNEYVSSPEKIEQDKELSAKVFPPSRPDELLCLIDIDSLWTGHIGKPGANRIAWEYLGCSYLLAKEMDKFKSFVLQTGRLAEWQPLPVHFQEAALVLSVEDISILDSVFVRSEVFQRFRLFQKDVLHVKNRSDGLPELYRRYGDTFWFYYYCKKLNGR